MSEYGDDAETEMGENPFADIEEYIEDTNAIVSLAIGAATFKVEHGLILMLKAEGFFRNSTDDDPTQHLRNFLAGDARKWLQNLPPNSIHSWPELVRAFLSKWFPQSKKSKLRDKIFFFKQIQGEQLHKSWDRFKLYLVRSPNHGFPNSMLLEKFYMGLDPMNQAIAKNAADGSFMDKSFARVTQILDKMAKHNQAWHSEDTTGGISYGSPSLSNLIKENQERDQVIVGLATNVNVLTKMFTENQTKKVNAVEDVQPILDENFEETNFINNPQGGYQRQPYHGQGQQSQWRPNPQGQGNQQWRNDQGHYANQGSSSESKLKSMIERVLQNQEKSDASMRNMTEVVGSHTASIQKLQMQMSDLRREQNPKQKGQLPSDTIANPKSGGSGSTSHVMEITTRSGKVLQGDIEQEVVGEEAEQEVEAEEQGVVKVERVSEKEK
uniref:Retrotransposon gag domain-containing protein n=1 Tax=Nicotiana tabacum TaxID=4097 RepID=A0A1S4AWE0_TOBAC